MNETLASAEAADPTRLGAYYTAGRQLLMDGRELERSEQCFRHYLTREPEFGWPSHGGAHWRLGQLLEKRGEKSAAIAELETAIKLQPDLADAKKDLKRLKG
jgi:tetratricopeptide (TPR) repeat protein